MTTQDKNKNRNIGVTSTVSSVCMGCGYCRVFLGRLSSCVGIHHVIQNPDPSSRSDVPAMVPIRSVPVQLVSRTWTRWT